MTTYRERREAKAERLRGWAEKREAKAAADLAQARKLGDVIPFGQPILVGHHSEGRDRNYRAKINRTYERSFENAGKAASMTARAEGIEAALDTSIYSDDVDAIEKLREKIARLEAERKRITDYNASCRKALKADPASTHGDLTLLDAHQRSSLASHARYSPPQKGGRFPAYATSNLSGLLSKSRERLARLERAAKAAEEL